jgi:hypothetical protein
MRFFFFSPDLAYPLDIQDNFIIDNCWNHAKH